MHTHTAVVLISRFLSLPSQPQHKSYRLYCDLNVTLYVQCAGFVRSHLHDGESTRSSVPERGPKCVCV